MVKRIFFIIIIILSLKTNNIFATTYDSYIVKYADCVEAQIVDSEDLKYYIGQENDIISTLNASDKEIEYIEPNYTVNLFAEYNSNINWNVEKIKAYPAWEYNCFGNDVRIGIIDSGIYDDGFFESKIIDGYNFIDNSTDTSDNIGHGTFVSSIIGYSESDFFSQGIAKKTTIIPLKCFDTNYTTKANKIAAAIRYAVDVYNCDIINMSFGLSNNSKYLEQAIQYALENNVILIAAVGNYGSSALQYPAAYEGVIGVGSIDSNSDLCDFSQYNNSVDVVAPGSGLYGFSIEDYSENSGTSFSAPHVSAAAAIAKSISPDITPYEFEKLIQETSCDLGETGYDIYYGHGMLDVEKLSLDLISSYDIFMSPVNVENNISSVTIFNNNQNDITAVNIFSQYSNNKFEGCNITNLKLGGKEKITIFNEVDENTIRCFLWETLTNLKPLTTYREYSQ